MTPVLNVRNLTVSYGTHTALSDLDLDLYAGEVTGVIGPNGAGKTSLIKALCGRLTPKNGDISVLGKNLSRGRTRQKLMGLVPQDIGLYPHLTASENLLVFAKIMGLSRTQRKGAANKALEAVGLTAKANIRVEALSGGMKRRINVAAAIMHGPEVLILDEPTAGVDIPARDTIHRIAQDLAKSGMAVLLVTHELEQAEALCDRIVILAKGYKLADGPPADILKSCYKGAREVSVRFSKSPNKTMIEGMRPFDFQPGELPTIWNAMTDTNEVSFVSAFMSALKSGEDAIQEVSVRRPGLASLMHTIEETGALPC